MVTVECVRGDRGVYPWWRWNVSFNDCGLYLWWLCVSMVTVECIRGNLMSIHGDCGVYPKKSVTSFLDCRKLIADFFSLSLLRQLGEIFYFWETSEWDLFPKCSVSEWWYWFPPALLFHQRLARVCDNLVNAVAMTKRFVWWQNQFGFLTAFSILRQCGGYRCVHFTCWSCWRRALEVFFLLFVIIIIIIWTVIELLIQGEP